MENAIRVVDLPNDATPAQAEELLNAPGDSFMLVQILPLASGHRAYLRRYKQGPHTKAEAAQDVSDATAMSIIRANRNESVRTIVSLLAKAGVKRGKQWVCEALDQTCAEDGKEEAARAYVNENCLFYEPKEIVFELREFQKIKRSLAWSRRTQEELRNASAIWTPEKQKEVDAGACPSPSEILRRTGLTPL